MRRMRSSSTGSLTRAQLAALHAADAVLGGDRAAKAATMSCTALDDLVPLREERALVAMPTGWLTL